MELTGTTGVRMQFYAIELAR